MRATQKNARFALNRRREANGSAPGSSQADLSRVERAFPLPDGSETDPRRYLRRCWAYFPLPGGVRGGLTLFHAVLTLFHAVLTLFHAVLTLFHDVLTLFHDVPYLFHAVPYLFHAVPYLFHAVPYLFHAVPYLFHAVRTCAHTVKLCKHTVKLCKHTVKLCEQMENLTGIAIFRLRHIINQCWHYLDEYQHIITRTKELLCLTRMISMPAVIFLRLFR